MVDGFDKKLSLVVQCLFGWLALLIARFVAVSGGSEFSARTPAASEQMLRLRSSWAVLSQPEGWFVGKVRLLPLAVRAVPPDTAIHQPDLMRRSTSAGFRPLPRH